MALAITNGQVDLGTGHICQVDGRLQLQLDLRVAAAEVRQARRQPQGGEGGQQADTQNLRWLCCQQRPGGFGDLFQGRMDLLVIAGAGGGQVDGPGASYKQRLAQVLFEFVHLMADRALADAQFPGRLAETQVPGHGLEGAQGQQRRQVLGHFHMRFPVGRGGHCADKKSSRQRLYCSRLGLITGQVRCHVALLAHSPGPPTASRRAADIDHE